MLGIETAGVWWAASNGAPEEQPMTDWHETWGDRAQQLVFIGQQLEPTHINNVLEACLLTDAEIAAGADTWTQWHDPFPQFVAG